MLGGALVVLNTHTYEQYALDDESHELVVQFELLFAGVVKFDAVVVFGSNHQSSVVLFSAGVPLVLPARLEEVEVAVVMLSLKAHYNSFQKAEGRFEPS